MCDHKKGDDMLKNTFSIGWLIKRYIKMRNYTMKQVADILNIKYTTFSGRIVRDDIDAELLFQLANLLEMDLAWMAQLFDKHRPIGLLDKYQMSRMSEKTNYLQTVIISFFTCWMFCFRKHILYKSKLIAVIAKNITVYQSTQIIHRSIPVILYAEGLLLCNFTKVTKC